MDFSSLPQNLSFLSSSRIRREIVGFGKYLFCELVPCVEVTLVSKIYLIWSTIFQESNLGSKGQILGEKHIFQRPTSRQCSALLDNVRRDLDKV
jgi:hypothetical protein